MHKSRDQEPSMSAGLLVVNRTITHRAGDSSERVAGKWYRAELRQTAQRVRQP